jgi:hypothetical protein
MMLGLFYRRFSVDLLVEVCSRAAATAVSRHSSNNNNNTGHQGCCVLQA